MPNKNESLSVWHSILGQRNMLYENMKLKITKLYDHVIETCPNSININSFSKSSKLLVPYTDTEWNKLKIEKEERKFNIFVKDTAKAAESEIIMSQLFLDEAFVKEK